MLNRFLLIIALGIPLCGYSQGYADSPFYKIVSAVPSTARDLGQAPGGIANGVVIDISMLEPAPFTPRLTTAWVERSTPEHIFHYFRQYDRLNAVFGYDLRVEPIQGTDQIRCTLTTLTDPIDQPPDKFQRLGLGLRNKSMPVVELPGSVYGPNQTLMNDTAYGNYHKFGSESRMLPGFEVVKDGKTSTRAKDNPLPRNQP